MASPASLAVTIAGPANSIKASAVRNSMTRFPSNRSTSQIRRTISHGSIFTKIERNQGADNHVTCTPK
nr:hypothetical protein Iba_chr09eCG2050 [Ipomoea batatas]